MKKKLVREEVKLYAQSGARPVVDGEMGGRESGRHPERGARSGTAERRGFRKR